MSIPKSKWWALQVEPVSVPKPELKWYSKPKPLFTIDPWELFICLIIGALLSLAIFG